ncbi:conjugal transfer protein TraF [Vibrio sonorensis]|uniref:conjugal transfer protein TraF n=1 Tax=Vibrio sonorensis TaxID=1004316 RepID=UPI0008DB0CE4|nr:conjugal transfer protein TraF [Vibrio sonorensis]
MKKRTFLKLATGSLASLVLPNALAMQPNTNRISDKYAVVFFFLSTCPECHKFSPKLRQLQALTGIPVYDFSIDGKAIPDFPRPMAVDQEIYQTFFPNRQETNAVPATFLINVNTIKFVRMTIGDVTYEQLNHSFTNILNDREVLLAME